MRRLSPLQSFASHASVAAGITIPTITLTAETVGRFSVMLAGICIQALESIGYRDYETGGTLALGTLGTEAGSYLGVNERKLAVEMFKTTVAAVVILGANRFYGEKVARRFHCNPKWIKKGVYNGVLFSTLFSLIGAIPSTTSTVALVGGLIAGATAGLFPLTGSRH